MADAGLTQRASAFDCIVLEQIERLGPELAARVIVVTSHVTGCALLRRAIRMRVFAVFGKPLDTAVFAEW